MREPVPREVHDEHPDTGENAPIPLEKVMKKRRKAIEESRFESFFARIPFNGSTTS